MPVSKARLVSSKVLAYTQKATHHPDAISCYLAWTEQGIRPPVYMNNREVNIDLADLMMAHSVASKEPSALLEGLWLDGMADYPLGRVLIDFLAADKETFLRKRPVFERAYRLHRICNGR